MRMLYRIRAKIKYVIGLFVLCVLLAGCGVKATDIAINKNPDYKGTIDNLYVVLIPGSIPESLADSIRHNMERLLAEQEIKSKVVIAADADAIRASEREMTKYRYLMTIKVNKLCYSVHTVFAIRMLDHIIFGITISDIETATPTMRAEVKLTRHAGLFGAKDGVNFAKDLMAELEREHLLSA